MSAALLGASCSNVDEHAGAATSFPVPTRVYITPDDLTTHVGVTPIRLSFSDAPDDESLAGLRANVQLQTYPDLVSVPISTTVQIVTDDGQPATSATPLVNKYVFVTPRVALPTGAARGSEQWFIVSIKALPRGFASGNPIPNPSPLSAAQVSRFGMGSQPVIREVKLGASGRVEIPLSEGVLVDPKTIGSTLRISSVDGAACTFVPIPGGSREYTTIDFDCAASVWSTMAIHIELQPGLRSATGIPLGVIWDRPCVESGVSDPSGFSGDVDFAMRTSCGTNCVETTPMNASPCRATVGNP